jgi:hypothetical protein
MKINTELERIIELDNSVNYIIPVTAKGLSLLPEFDCHHDFIQFETGSKEDKSDLAFIWDFETKKIVETLD